MKVLIVAKTRQGSAACIGGITFEGRSIRLVSSHPDEHWGLDFQVGEVWEVEGGPPDSLVPPHNENFVVRSGRCMGRMTVTTRFIERHMPAVCGSPGRLFDGLVQQRPSGALCIEASTGVPSFSTQFWRPDRPLHRETSGKRIRYRYAGRAVGASLVFVGFQEPIEEIPAGTLVRVSLAHWWRSCDRPEDPLRCYVQLSGWLDSQPASAEHGHISRQRLGSTPPRSQCADLSAALVALEKTFGFREFRPIQEKILQSVLSGRDTLGIMPTGAGKSLCYQIPAILGDGLTVVVSPLISLMEDQVDQLRAVGVPAVALHSGLGYSEFALNTRQIETGQTKLLYLAPETLLRPETLVLLKTAGVRLFAIDEAHCISEWGHDFRVEYRQIHSVRSRFPDSVCLALTATATERVRTDIQRLLHIPIDSTFIAGFDRPNLFLAVRRRQDGVRQVIDFLSERKGQRGIIYSARRDDVDQLVARLCGAGIRALPYHAGMSDADRRASHRTFQHDEVDVIVATIAFGMGINKPDVRFILHTALPGSLETYYQQVGRAGRDGLRADCLLLHARADLNTAQYFIDQGAPEQRAGRAARLHAMARYAESRSCRRRILLPYFGDPAREGNCGGCDNCLRERSDVEMRDVSSAARSFLECVKQTGERFGRGHIVDVLRGSKAERIRTWNHDRLQCYGTGINVSAADWRTLANCFIDAGIIEVEMEYGMLKLTPSGLEVLAGAPVLIPQVDIPMLAAQRDPAECDSNILEALRSLRWTIAREESVPAFMVFSDRSLMDMAARRPRSREEFLRVHGVGERKAENYAARFLSTIEMYLAENQAELDPAIRKPKPRGGSRHIELAEAFRSGQTISELQAGTGLARATILQHLKRYLDEVGYLPAERLRSESTLSRERQEQILELFRIHGDHRLGPIFALLEGAVPYEELHVLRMASIADGRKGTERSLEE